MNSTELIVDGEIDEVKESEIKKEETPSPDTSLINIPDFKRELAIAISNNKHLWTDRILKKIDSLLDATTTDKRWVIIPDNNAQIEALKLLLKLQWMNVWPTINFNLLHIPNPNEKLRY